MSTSNIPSLTDPCPRCGRFNRGTTHACFVDPPVQRLMPIAATTATRPYKCPVCVGRGTVPPDFYEQIGYSTGTNRPQCRSCQGRGVLWGAG